MVRELEKKIEIHEESEKKLQDGDKKRMSEFSVPSLSVVTCLSAAFDPGESSRASHTTSLLTLNTSGAA